MRPLVRARWEHESNWMSTLFVCLSICSFRICVSSTSDEFRIESGMECTMIIFSAKVFRFSSYRVVHPYFIFRSTAASLECRILYMDIANLQSKSMLRTCSVDVAYWCWWQRMMNRCRSRTTWSASIVMYRGMVTARLNFCVKIIKLSPMAMMSLIPTIRKPVVTIPAKMHTS